MYDRVESEQHLVESLSRDFAYSRQKNDTKVFNRILVKNGIETNLEKC